MYRDKREQPKIEVRLKQFEEEWPELKKSQWKLSWNYVGNWSYLVLQLKLLLKVAKKVNDISLYCVVDVVFYAKCEKDRSHCSVDVPDQYHEESLISLDQDSSFSHQFSHQFIFDRWNGFITASVTVKLVLLKCTLNIISEVEIPPLALGNDLEWLLMFETEDLKTEFSDVTINIATNEATSPSVFFAHKAILAARSPVFSKMFAHDLQERATNSVTLSDISPAAFKELLTYIYTGKVPHLQTLARSLLNAAEKYHLDRLKALCELQLSYDLEVENAAETLVLAHTYGADQLKKNALRFIVKYRNEVRKTKDWEKVHNTCELLEELLDTALEQSDKK